MKKLVVLVLGLLFVAFASMAQTNEKSIDIKSVENVLKQEHATWDADDKWINGRSREELKRLLGADPLPEDAVTFEIPESFEKNDLPKVYDWRNVNGVNFVTPVLNQGNCGSCVAFSSIGTLETQVNITVPFSSPKFSTQSLFSCAGGACNFGMMFEDAIRHLIYVGVPDEACHPYVSGITGQDDSCSSGCSDKQSRTYKVLDVRRPTSGSTNLGAIKRALLNGPVLTRMTVYDDFFTYSSGVYKHVYGSVAGGHGVSIVGFDDEQRAWVVKNSWGTSWGDNGFVLISYDDTSGVGRQTWQFEVPRADGYVRVAYPQNKEFVTGTAKFRIENTFPQMAQTKVQIYDTKKNQVHEDSCSASNCEITLNTSDLTDGRYEVFATAIGKNDKRIESQREYFYVLNNFTNMNIKLIANFDSTEPISDVARFDIEADVNGIPLSAVELRVVSGDEIVYTKRTDSVAPEMTMSWRTITVPNGQYEVFLVGELNTDEKVIKAESARIQVTVKN